MPSTELPGLGADWSTALAPMAVRVILKPRQVLLRAGDVARTCYLLEKGCARLYVLDPHGKETTTQFFFEGEMVCSMESFLTGTPSRMYLATIEASEALAIDGDLLKATVERTPALQTQLQALLIKRLMHYVNLHASSVSETPTQRYQALVNEQPRLVERVPLQMLAAYLGITPVHLSRIRSKTQVGSQPE